MKINSINIKTSLKKCSSCNKEILSIRVKTKNKIFCLPCAKLELKNKIKVLTPKVKGIIKQKGNYGKNIIW